MRKWLPLTTVCLGTFMLLIDVTIVNVALPDMAGDLGASFGALQWVVDAYALALAALVLGAGSIADLVGHRRAYIGGLAVFAASSLMCGLAPDPGMHDHHARGPGRRGGGHVRDHLRPAQQRLPRPRPG
ncbi:MFS transporter [Frankia sp. QA3]|uniref:MFS transporter n=1 Tax=Frankia sp. QA3 TaxID=710111 RepID=UPI0002DF5B4B|nr:MFS transporter [Frankia sp. QA3]